MNETILKLIVANRLRQFHQGREKRAEKWAFVEQVCDVLIPEDQRNNNNMHERRVRQAISELRKDNVLICSDPKGGYWMAGSLEDALSVSTSLRSRARDLLLTARKLREEARREFGKQLKLL